MSVVQRISGAVFSKWARVQHTQASRIRFQIGALFFFIGFIIFCVEATKSRLDGKDGGVFAMVSPGTESAKHFANGIEFPKLTLCASPFVSDSVQIDTVNSKCYFIDGADHPEGYDGIRLVTSTEDQEIVTPDGDKKKVTGCMTVLPKAAVLGSKNIVAKNDTETIKCEIRYMVDTPVSTDDPVEITWSDFVFASFWGGANIGSEESWESESPPSEIRFWKTFNAYTYNLMNINVVSFEDSKRKMEGYFFKSEIAHTSHLPLFDKSKDPEPVTVANQPSTIINYSFDTYFFSQMVDLKQRLYPSSTMWGVCGGWWFIMTGIAGLVVFIVFSAMGISDNSDNSIGGAGGYVSTPPPSYASSTYNASTSNPFDNGEVAPQPSNIAEKDGYGSIA